MDIKIGVCICGLGGGEGKKKKRKNMREKWPARTCMVREHGTRGCAEKINPGKASGIQRDWKESRGANSTQLHHFNSGNIAPELNKVAMGKRQSWLG